MPSLQTQIKCYKIESLLFPGPNYLCNILTVTSVYKTRFLGVITDGHLNFHSPLEYLTNKLSSTWFVKGRLSFSYDNNVLITTYYGVFYSYYSTQFRFGEHKTLEHFICFELKWTLNNNWIFKKSCRPLWKKITVLTFSCIYILQAFYYWKLHKKFNLRK